jgi:hypothetical protein
MSCCASIGRLISLLADAVKQPHPALSHASLAAAQAFLYPEREGMKGKPMVFLVMVLKAAAIATIQFSNMNDCMAAKKAMTEAAADAGLVAVCLDKVATAPGSGG